MSTSSRKATTSFRLFGRELQSSDSEMGDDNEAHQTNRAAYADHVTAPCALDSG